MLYFPVSCALPQRRDESTGLPGRFWFAWGLLLVCLAALGLRVWAVWGKGLWNDEIISVTLRAPHATTFKLFQARILNLWLLAHILAFTRNELALRLPNIAGSTLAVLFTGLWIRRALGRREGLAAAACLAVAPRFIQHTSLCRAYGLLACFAVLAAWACWEWSEHPRTWWWLLVLGGAGAGFFVTREEGLFVLAGLAAVLPLLVLVRRPFKRRNAVALAATYLVGYILFSVVVWWGLQHRPTLNSKLQAFLPGLAGAPALLVPLALLRGMLQVFGARSLQFVFDHTFVGVWMPLVVVALVLGLFATAVRNWRLLAVLVVWAVVGQAATELMTRHVLRIPFDARHLQLVTTAWLILFVAGATALTHAARSSRSGQRRPALHAAGLLWMIACLAAYALAAGKATTDLIRYQRIADWKQIAALSHAAHAEDRCLVTSGRSFELGYYHPSVVQGNLDTALRELQRTDAVYFLPGNAAGLQQALDRKQVDALWLPFEPHPVLMLTRPASASTQYWQRAYQAYDHALRTVGPHAQLRAARAAAYFMTLTATPVHAAADTADAEIRTVPCDDWQPVLGWGHREHLDTHTYRWSTMQRCVLNLPAYPGRLHRIALAGMPFMPSPRPIRMTAWLGHALLGSCSLTSGWNSYVFAVPGEVAPGETRLDFKFATPLSPELAGTGGDTRMLTFALGTITLGVVPQQAPRAIAVGTIEAEPYLGPAWSHCETWPDGRTYRWLAGTTGTVYWGTAPPSRWQLTLLPFVAPNRAQHVSVIENGTALTNFPLQPEWLTYDCEGLKDGSRVRQLELICSYAVAPAALGMGADTRRLSCAVEQIVREDAP